MKKINKPPMTTLPKKGHLDSYILLNPRFPPELAFRMLNMKPGEETLKLVLKGKEKDFEDCPNTVFKTIDQKIILKGGET